MRRTASKAPEPFKSYLSTPAGLAAALLDHNDLRNFAPSEQHTKEVHVTRARGGRASVLRRLAHAVRPPRHAHRLHALPAVLRARPARRDDLCGHQPVAGGRVQVIHRAGVESMALRRTRRFSTNAP